MNEINGLVRKDWLLMSRKAKMLFLYILVMVVVFSIMLSGSNALAGFFTVLMFLLSINCFAYDEQVNFDKLAAASPVLPIKIALSRYFAALSVGVVGSAIIMLVNYLVLAFRKSNEIQSEQTLETFIGSMVVAIFMVSVFFPLFYKFGVNKSRLVILLVFGIPSLLYLTATTILPKDFFSGIRIPDAFLNMLPFLIVLVVAGALVGSVYLSAGILQHKEY